MIDQAAYWQQVAECMALAALLRGQKDADYNANGVEVTDYWLHGEQTLIDHLWHKVLRLRSLEGRNFVNEGVDDTILDIINYAAYLWALRRVK